MAVMATKNHRPNIAILFFRRRIQASCPREEPFSAVSMVPINSPQTSRAAISLAPSLGMSDRGTWQSAQLARTPDTFLKWMESIHSASFHCMEWQEVQNSVVLVASSTIEAPMEPANPTATSMIAAAAETVFHIRLTLLATALPVKTGRAHA